MLTLLFAIIAVALFLLGVLFVWEANYRPQYRYLQLLFPFVAVIYSIVGYFLIDTLSGAIRDLVDLIVSSLPLDDFNMAVAIALVFNFLFLVGFSILKPILRLLLRIFRKPYEKILKDPIAHFYDLSKETGYRFLRPSFVGVRRLFRNMFVAVLVLSCVLFFGSQMAPEWSLFRNPFYPAFPVLILGEIVYCLSGVTKDEYRGSVEAEDEGAHRVSNYGKLLNVYRHYFGDRILSVTSLGSADGLPYTHDDFCQALIDDGDHTDAVAGRYFQMLLRNGLLTSGNDGAYGELNHDYALSCVRLMHGRSVMFANPFWRDFIPYVFLPVNSQLIRNRKVLVLYGDGIDEQAMVDYMNEGLEFVTGFENLWTIGGLGADRSSSPDIALLSFSSLGDAALLRANADYFKDVSIALVINPSSLLGTYQIGMNILADLLAVGESCCYCIFDRNSDGLVDSLSHALRTNLTEVAATEHGGSVSTGVLWNVDGEFLQHRLFPGVAHYLGVGTELGLVALREQVERVDWVAEESIPLVDQRWIDGQYYGELLHFAELPQEQLQLDHHFHFHSTLWGMGRRRRCFVIAEDEPHNLFETYRQFTTRGTSQSFVNVLAPNYALRSYMVHNPDIFVADSKAVPSLAPDFAKSRRNAIVTILLLAAQTKMPIEERELLTILGRVGLRPTEGLGLPELLADLLREHVPLDGAATLESPIDLVEDEVYDGEVGAYVARRRYEFADDSPYERCFRELRNVPIQTEMPDGTRELLGARLYGHVYQFLLPSQYCVINGKNYEVVAIDEDGVALRRASDHFDRRHYYRQLRTFHCGEAPSSPEGDDDAGRGGRWWTSGGGVGDERTITDVKVQRIAASFEIETVGYLDLEDRGDLADAHVVGVSDIPVRSYLNKHALRLEFANAPQTAVNTIAVLISEFLVTLFPESHHYVDIVLPQRTGLPAGILPEFDGEEEEGVLYIIEDSLIDIGLVSSLDRHIRRILELCWDYLDWHLGMLAGEETATPQYELGEYHEQPRPESKPGFFRRVANRIAKLFRRKPKDDGTSAGSGSDGKATVPEPAPDPLGQADAESEPAPEPEGSPEARSGQEAALERGTALESEAELDVESELEPEAESGSESENLPGPGLGIESEDRTEADSKADLDVAGDTADESPEGEGLDSPEAEGADAEAVDGLEDGSVASPDTTEGRESDDEV